MNCPYCGKKDIPDDWNYCDNCGVNLKEYEKANEFIKRGKEFEDRFEYGKATEEYKKALELNIPHDKILQELERIARKEQEIIDTQTKAEELFSHQKWKEAIRAYEKLKKLNPASLWEIKDKLDKARYMLSRVHKRWCVWTVCIIILIGGAIGGWWSWTRTPAQVAQRTLRHAIVSDDVKEKLAAIEAIGRLQDKKLSPFLKDAIRDPRSVIRIATVRALGQIKDSSAIPLLKESLSDNNWEVRIESAQALALMGDSSGIEVLRRAIR